MSFPLDLTVPTAWNGPAPRSRIQSHGISPSGNWIGGTCLKLDLTATPPVNTSQEFAYRYSPFAPSWYEPQPLGAGTSASCRGISDHGDRVGFRAPDPSNPDATIAILHEHGGAVHDLPFGKKDVSVAMGVNASLFSGSFLIVGSHTPDGQQRAKGFGITYTTLGGFGPEILLGADIPPSPTEDVTVQCINLQGDLIATLVNNPDGAQRQFIGFRVLAPLPGHPLNHGYAWKPLQQPDFPVDPNTATILGLNSHGDISGFYPNGSKVSGFTVNAKLNGTSLKLSGFSTYDHPLATASTQFSGISEAGWIAGTYDSIHPFVFIPWHFSLLK